MATLLWKPCRVGTQILRISTRLSAKTERQYVTTSKCQNLAEASTVVDNQNDSQSRILKSVSEIPGPRRFPIVGSFPSMIMDKDFKMDKLHLYWRKLKPLYGDVVKVDFPGMGTAVLLFNPKDIEHLARVTLHNPHRDFMASYKKIRDEAEGDYFEGKSGIISENGEEWQRIRSRVQTPMMKPKNVQAYLSQMDEVTLDFLDRIAHFQKELGEMPRDFQMELYKWALESVSLVALSRRLGCLNPDLKEDSEPMVMINNANIMMESLQYTEMKAQWWRLFPTPAYKRLKNSHQTFLKIADENIKRTEAQLLAKDPESMEDLTLMETLLLTPGLSRKDVVTLILDMLFAGIDTTANAMAFALYLLARHPRVQLKMQEEIDRVIGDHQGHLTPKMLGQMTYVKAVVKETVRVFPLVPGVMRSLKEDAVFGGYLVPKGHLMGAWNMIACCDEEVFPKAKEFIPERWLRDRPEGHSHPYGSLPFGLGTRMCIGRRISEQEMYILLARVMQRFNVDYKYDDIDITTRLVFTASEPLRFNFIERKQ